MSGHIKFRLSVMMFLEYFVWGVWYVTVGTWLATRLHFSGEQVGIVAGATAVGATVAPFFVGLIADKYFATEKVLALLHIVGGFFLFAASSQTNFAAIYSLLLVYCLCYMPTLALTNSLCFRQLQSTEREFGGIRVLGTLGWIVAGILVGTLGIEATSHPLQIAAVFSVIMGLYCLTLPKTPPLANKGAMATSIFPKETFTLLKERSMAVFAIASFLICIPLQFYYAFTNLFLNQLGVHNAAGKMTGGQMSELFCMLLIPWFFRRLGVKYMLVAGIAAWVIRYALFAYGNAGSLSWMLVGGIILHGICYDFFFVTGQIYIDRKASAELRAAAQGLIFLLTYGVGMFVGSWLSGAVVEHYGSPAADGTVLYNWHSIWIIAGAASLAVLIFFLFTFSERKAPSYENARLEPSPAVASLDSERP